jgi:hypothetical protein
MGRFCIKTRRPLPAGSNSPSDVGFRTLLKGGKTAPRARRPETTNWATHHDPCLIGAFHMSKKVISLSIHLFRLFDDTIPAIAITVTDMNCLRPLECCGQGFQFHFRHSCLCVFIPFVLWQKHCDWPIFLPRSPTDSVQNEVTEKSAKTQQKGCKATNDIGYKRNAIILFIISNCIFPFQIAMNETALSNIYQWNIFLGPKNYLKFRLQIGQ